MRLMANTSPFVSSCWKWAREGVSETGSRKTQAGRRRKKEGERVGGREGEEGVCRSMGSEATELYFVFLNFDPEYERLKGDRTKKGAHELDVYLSNKHDQLLARMFQPNSYNKRSSLVIVDGFAVEITDEQANSLRSAKEVRIVEKNLELD